MDEYLLPLMLIGGDGGVNALAHLTPELHKKLIESLKKNNLPEALSTYIKIMELKRLYDITPSVTAAIKAGLNILGYPIERYVRPPLEPVSDDAIPNIKEIFKSLELI
jgi:4-hydroxy-tetrahydrodipicolinate synthase